MHHQHTHNRRHSRTCRGGREGGFSLVEILVVVTILLILIGMGVLWFGSGRTAGNLARTVATAEAYATAAEQFSSDHRGLYPSDKEWPANDAGKGPVHQLSRASGVYLRNVPEDVKNGAVVVAVVADRSETPDAATRGRVGTIHYVPKAETLAGSPAVTGYELMVFDHIGNYSCSFSANLTVTGLRDCTTR